MAFSELALEATEHRSSIRHWWKSQKLIQMKKRGHRPYLLERGMSKNLGAMS